MLISCDQLIVFNILDIDINLLDHIPMLAICACDVSSAHSCERVKSALSADVTHLTWDHTPFNYTMIVRTC